MSVFDNSVEAVLLTAATSTQFATQVYDVKTGTFLHGYKGYPAAAKSLGVTGSERIVLCACKDRPLLQCWRLNHYKSVDIVLPGRAAAVAVSPTSPTLAAIGVGEIIYVYNLESGSRYAVIERHFQPVCNLLFLASGEYFISTAEDGFVYVWSVAAIVKNTMQTSQQSVQPFKQLHQHSDKVTCAAATERRLATGSADQTVLVYDLYTFSLLYTIVSDCPVTTVAISSSGCRIAIGSELGHISLLDIFPYKQAFCINVPAKSCEKGHVGAVTCLSFLSNSTSVISAGHDGEVKVWSVEGITKDLTQLTLGNDYYLHKLALQRTVHRGTGSVTNMIIMLLHHAQELDNSKSSEELYFAKQLMQDLGQERPITIRPDPYSSPAVIHPNTNAFVSLINSTKYRPRGSCSIKNGPQADD